MLYEKMKSVIWDYFVLLKPQIYRTISVFLWKEFTGTQQYLTESCEKDQRDGQATRTRYKNVTASEAKIKATFRIVAPI